MDLLLTFFGVGTIFIGIKIFLLSRSRSHLSKHEDYTGESILAQIMTTKEMAKYLHLHQITICKLSKEGKIGNVKSFVSREKGY
jgi:hypothetical protein